MAMYGSQRFHVLAIAVLSLRKAPSERKEDQRAGAVGTILLSLFFRWYCSCIDFNPRKIQCHHRAEYVFFFTGQNLVC